MGAERHKFTVAVNHEYKETESENSALSFLKFHLFKITFFEKEKLQIAKSILHEVHNNKNKIFSQFCVEHTIGFFFFKWVLYVPFVLARLGFIANCTESKHVLSIQLQFSSGVP